MIVLDLSILNQKGTPMFNSDLTANRPAAGIVGRIFIAIDSPYGIFRDTGTAWDQISSAGSADTNIYNTDGTLTGTRTVSSGGFQLVFNPQTTFFSSLIPSTTASSFSVLGSNTLTFAAGFSSSNIGNVYSANGAINAQIFSGNATFAQANLASAMVNVNKIDFGSGGHTITMTQSTAPGIRAMTGTQNQIQFTGSHNGTISHAAVSQNLGFFRETGSTRTLTITNAYSHLINPLDDYGAGFTFTNRWGIYQAGASDKNYFAANSLFGTTTDAGFRVDINGTARVSDNLIVSKNQNAVTSFIVNNTTSGTNSFALIRATSQNGYIEFAKLSATTNPYKMFLANDSYIYNLTSGDIALLNDYATGKIKFAAGSSFTAQMTLTAAGRLLLGTTTESTFLLDVNGTARVSDTLIVSRDQNAFTSVELYNATSGTNSAVSFSLNSDTLSGSGGIGKYSTLKTAYKIIASKDLYFSNNSTDGDIAILNDYASGNIKFSAGGSSTAQMTIKSNGRINMSSLPTSSVGLAAGDLWNNLGVINIV